MKRPIFPKTTFYHGVPDEITFNEFPVGLCTINTSTYLSLTFIDADGSAFHLFCLNPGRHTVNRPHTAVHIMAETTTDNRWSITQPSRFQPSDPTRVSAALVRPLSQREEMQDYVNELISRALGGKLADDLRAGKAELDLSEDDYSEEHEDDHDSPLSTYQMQILIDELSQELALKQGKPTSPEPPPPNPPESPQDSIPEPPAPDSTPE